MDAEQVQLGANGVEQRMIRLEHAALSHAGCVRATNEDAFCVRAAEGLFLVADGMGGHEHGEWASAAIADTLRAAPLPADFEAAGGAVADALHRANAVIFAEAGRRGSQMGSTAVALLVREGRYAVLWVGDSRAYLHRNGRLIRLTHDHTQVQEMIDRGLLSPRDAEGHPMGHILARAIGVRPALEVDVVSGELADGDVFLLCSDGLTARLSDRELGGFLEEPAPDRRVDQLVRVTLDRGAPDNVTVVSVDVHPTTILHLQPIPMVAR